MDELTILREQMNSLKESLNKSKIVTNRLMLTVMKQKSSWINNMVWGEVIGAPFIIFLIVSECAFAGISMWFAIIGAIGLIIDVWADFKTARISPKDILTMDMLSLRRKLLKQKRQRTLQCIIELPLGLIWGTWFAFAFFMNMFGEKIAVGSEPFWVIIGIIVVMNLLIIGITVGIYSKMQNTNDDLIRRINEMEEMEEKD